jgi:hypothetical protein
MENRMFFPEKSLNPQNNAIAKFEPARYTGH